MLQEPAKDLDFEWDLPLYYRKGSSILMRGLDVFYDFDWLEIMRHGRASIRNGYDLCTYVHRSCGSLRPTVLLTTQEKTTFRVFHTPTRHVVCCHVKELRSVRGNGFSTLLAKTLDRMIPDLSQLENWEVSEDTLLKLLDAHGKAETIALWLSRNPEIEQAVSVAIGESEEVPEPSIVSIVESLSAFSEEQLGQLADTLAKDNWQEAVRVLSSALALSRSGLATLIQITAEKIPERIQMARDAALRFTELLDSPGTNETDLQNFLMLNPWLLGLEYSQVIPKQQVIRGATDFLLRRADGWLDLLELKSPNDAIVTYPGESGTIGSPSQYCLSKSLALALAQAHAYKSQMVKHHQAIASMHGLQKSENPKVMIVIGKSGKLGEIERDILDELNKSLHGVSIVPFDFLSERCRILIANLESVFAEVEVKTE